MNDTPAGVILIREIKNAARILNREHLVESIVGVVQTPPFASTTRVRRPPRHMNTSRFDDIVLRLGYTVARVVGELNPAPVRSGDLREIRIHVTSQPENVAVPVLNPGNRRSSGFVELMNPETEDGPVFCRERPKPALTPVRQYRLGE